MTVKTARVKAGLYTACDGRFVIEHEDVYDQLYGSYFPWKVTDTSGAEPFIQKPRKRSTTGIGLSKAECVELIEAALEAESKTEVA